MTIAKAFSGHETVWLCIFGVLGLIPFATVRACTNPPVAMPNGEGLLTNTPVAAFRLPQRSATVRVTSKMPPGPALSRLSILGPMHPQPDSAGIAGTLVYGVVVINSQFVPEITLVWRNVSTHKIQPPPVLQSAARTVGILTHPMKLLPTHGCCARCTAAIPTQVNGDGRLCRCA